MSEVGGQKSEVEILERINRINMICAIARYYAYGCH
jgi:hypothetical protein